MDLKIKGYYSVFSIGRDNQETFNADLEKDRMHIHSWIIVELGGFSNTQGYERVKEMSFDPNDKILDLQGNLVHGELKADTLYIYYPYQ